MIPLLLHNFYYYDLLWIWQTTENLQQVLHDDDDADDADDEIESFSYNKSTANRGNEVSPFVRKLLYPACGREILSDAAIRPSVPLSIHCLSVCLFLCVCPMPIAPSQTTAHFSIMAITKH